MSIISESTVVIDHIGPIEYFEIDFSYGYGAYELNGTKGQGKSTVLDSLDLMAGRRLFLTVTDGFPSGSVRGFGVIVPVGGKKRRRGTMSLNALDAEKFSIADIVSPQVKDPEAADVQRIKAMVSLRNVQAEPADYFDLCGGRAGLEALVPEDKLSTDDPVLLASRVKEALEAKARVHEATAKHEATHAESYKIRVEGVDLTGESDANALQQALDAAKTVEITLRQQQKAYQVDQDRRQNARAALEAAKAGYTGPSLDEAQGALQTASANVSAADAKVRELTELLASAKAALSDARQQEVSAERAMASARHHLEVCTAWSEALEADPVAVVAEQDLLAASQAVAASQQALEQGVRIRDAMQASATARRHAAEADRQREIAEQYRAKALGVFDVLSGLVRCPGMKIESVQGAPRFVVIHPRRGKMLYHDMSDGERVYTAIEAVVDALQSPAVLTIAQRLWQDLPPADRLALHQYAMKHRLYIVGAQVTDDQELRLSFYGAKWSDN